MDKGIDDVMSPLIGAVNKIPYIETFSCCKGHPEESAVEEYDYAVANVIFEIKDEPQYNAPGSSKEWGFCSWYCFSIIWRESIPPKCSSKCVFTYFFTLFKF